MENGALAAATTNNKGMTVADYEKGAGKIGQMTGSHGRRTDWWADAGGGTGLVGP